MSVEPAHRVAAVCETEGFRPARADLDAMRRYLVEQRPASGNEALRILRSAFPDSPLGQRVKAAEQARLGGF